jgi:serine/threonine-protein kinase RIO1
VQDLLAQLANAGFTGAPRPLGVDDQGREVVSFVEGVVPLQPPYLLTDAGLLSATSLIRSYHDITARLPLRGSEEVVCHGDLGPHNTVFRGHRAVALIDWDEDVRPGRRAVDFAHAVWCFADLCEDDVPLPEQAAGRD